MKRENEHKEYCEQDIVDQISRMSEDTEVPDSLRSENIDKLLEKKKQKNIRLSVKKRIPYIWHWNLSNNTCRLW